MTATTGNDRASPALWIGLLIVVALVVLTAFLTSDDPELGGRADPNGVGPEGLLALRNMIEETGGQTAVIQGAPTADHHVAVLGTTAYDLQLEEDMDLFAPILSWVESGGLLITGVETDEGPVGAFAAGTSDIVSRDECTIDRLDGLQSISAPDHTPIEIEARDRSCFGSGDRAVVVERRVGEGSIVRISELEPFFNRFLDEEDNGAVAVRLFGMQAAPSVAFLEGPDLADLFGGAGGPVNEDGEPIGVGDKTLIDLVDPSVFAMFAGLAGAGLLYALARGRRLGSPIEEPLPIELPSSDYTVAVGRLYARTDGAIANSTSLLQKDFRRSAARRIGASPDLPAEDLAAALALTSRGSDPETLTELLEHRTPQNEREFVSLAAELAHERDRMQRGNLTNRKDQR